MDQHVFAVEVAQERLLAGAPVDAGVRQLVWDSWQRCHEYGVDPEAPPPAVDLTDDALEAYRLAHPLAVAMPVVRRLLTEHAASDDLIVAVSDAGGRLLWVEGAPGMRTLAEGMHFAAGAQWDERHAGTNAPALALRLDAPVGVSAAEHWARQVQPWSCSAVPVHHPGSGLVLGALDVTGDSRAASASTLALIRATVAAVEREILLHELKTPVAQAVWDLTVLGPHAGRISRGASVKQMSLRHAELVLVLLQHPDGLTARELIVELDERDLDPVTVRAELSRLRRVLGEDCLAAQPYRLRCRVETDLQRVRALLDAGCVHDAVGVYAGRLLPRSSAPRVLEIREELERELRGAVLHAADAGLLQRWAESPWGHDDADCWRACATLLAPGAHRDRISAHADLLDERLA